MEPEPKTLIAFNAAPGTVAPDQSGNYGAYAQALAEMIRAGGIALPEVFNRVRLRVNDVTKGAEVPWDAQKLEGEFLFFERAPDAPAVEADKDAAQRAKPIREMDAKTAYTAALERDTIADYEAFIAAFPDDPLAKRARAIIAARREAITWRRTYRADTPQAYWSYLKRYPRGPHAADARRRLAVISAALEPPPVFDEYGYDLPPPPPEEIVYISGRVMFYDPAFDSLPPPPPLFFLPPPPTTSSCSIPDLLRRVYYLRCRVHSDPGLYPAPVYVRRRIPLLFANIHNRNVNANIINRRRRRCRRAAAGGRPAAAGRTGRRSGASGVCAGAAAVGGAPRRHDPAGR